LRDARAMRMAQRCAAPARKILSLVSARPTTVAIGA